MTGLEGISAVASAASGVISAIGALSQAQAAAAAAEYNAKVQERNAVIADQNRQLAIQTSEIAAEDKQRDNRRVLAALRAAYGASGLEMAGSPLDVLADTAAEQELDVARIRYEGRVRGREGTLQMLGFREEAKLSRMRGDAAQTAGAIGAIGSIFSGAGNVLERLG